ncbi:hypothetical protein EYR40_004024 [Pleurotus pulmonarius]|nr:hypothetical protein EYR40_004024 [Pleurotus pulmonarius]
MLEEPEQSHRRSSCDELLFQSEVDMDDQNSIASSQSSSVASVGDVLPQPVPRRTAADVAARKWRMYCIRLIALLCACSLSIGSHYASYVLGPLKSRLSRELGTSHTEFSLLISAFSLNSTWTPLVGGVMASRLGTTFTSILATGVILFGQILLLTGDIYGNVRMMALGMFVFGLGVSPLAVVQETIIVRFFKSHGLGVSMAFGLIAGKGASFISARTSYPLTERFGSRAPFYVATGLAALSVFVNLIYIAASRWLVDGAGAELEAADIDEEARRRSCHDISQAQALEKVAEKRRVHIKEITKLGDIFWSYVGLNVLCGAIWSPFTHLAANIVEKRYGMTEEDAANQASYLLAGSLVLYPICGYIVDRYKSKQIVIRLFMLSSILTGSCYLWLSLPPSWTQSSWPGILSFCIGHGFAPLLLVVLVPKIVALKYVSTALGVHKSLEQTGSTIFQTMAGLALDMHNTKPQDPKGPTPPSQKSSIQTLLNIFVFLNGLQFLSILALSYLQQRQKRLLRHRSSISEGALSDSVNTVKPHNSGSINEPQASGSDHSQERPLLGESEVSHTRYSSTMSRRSGPTRDEVRQRGEIRRGRIFVTLSASLIIFAWVLFMGTAWFRLGLKHETN